LTSLTIVGGYVVIIQQLSFFGRPAPLIETLNDILPFTVAVVGGWFVTTIWLCGRRMRRSHLCGRVAASVAAAGLAAALLGLLVELIAPRQWPFDAAWRQATFFVFSIGGPVGLVAWSLAQFKMATRIESRLLYWPSLLLVCLTIAIALESTLLALVRDILGDPRAARLTDVASVISDYLPSAVVAAFLLLAIDAWLTRLALRRLLRARAAAER
jgi:hypothetical protein